MTVRNSKLLTDRRLTHYIVNKNGRRVLCQGREITTEKKVADAFTLQLFLPIKIRFVKAIVSKKA